MKYVGRLLCAATSLVLLPACTGGHPSGSFPTALAGATIRPPANARQVVVTEQQQGSTIEVSVGTVLVVKLSKISGAGWGSAHVAPPTVLSLDEDSHVGGGRLDATVETKAPGRGYVFASLECSAGKCRTWGVTVVVRR